MVLKNIGFLKCLLFYSHCLLFYPEKIYSLFVFILTVKIETLLQTSFVNNSLWETISTLPFFIATRSPFFSFLRSSTCKISFFVFRSYFYVIGFLWNLSRLLRRMYKQKSCFRSGPKLPAIVIHIPWMENYILKLIPVRQC